MRLTPTFVLVAATALAAFASAGVTWNLPKLSQIVTGGFHTCGVTLDGALYCWGGNGYGKLGDGTTGSQTVRTSPVLGLDHGVNAVALGISFTCAITSSGGAQCWGENGSGQLGNGKRALIQPTPVDVIGLPSPATAVSAGYSHTCAVLTPGDIMCWGSGLQGQLGNGVYTSSLTPTLVISLSAPAIGVAAGGAGMRTDFTCAALVGGAATCWGYNGDGQLGDGTNQNRNIPTPVVGLGSGVRSVTVGTNSACAAMLDGSAKCWGNNSGGKLGDGTTNSSNTPVTVMSLTDVIDIYPGFTSTCARVAGGGVKCWGENKVGQLGDGTNQSRLTPDWVTGFQSGAQTLGFSGATGCVVTANGGGKCWGLNYSGELGNGSTNHSNVPVDVIGFGDVPLPMYLPLVGR